MLSDFVSAPWRILLAFLTSLIFSWALYPSLIRYLAKIKFGQSVRQVGPKTHLTKSGTPTMGGILLVLSILLSIFLWNKATEKVVSIALVVIAVAILGFIDDFLKIKQRNSAGVAMRFKMLWLFLVTVIFVLTHLKTEFTHLWLPFFGSVMYGAVGFFILSFFVLCGSANAVNLSDGLDGLATILVSQVSFGLFVIAFFSQDKSLATYFNLQYRPDFFEIAIILSATLGACLAFLRFNIHPAKVFMGDVGSLTLGALLGTVALLMRQEFIFFIMTILFVIEAVSVILQLGSLRLRKKRIFLMAPIHHHFEQKGWRETKVVKVFSLFGFLFLSLSLIIFFNE